MALHLTSCDVIPVPWNDRPSWSDIHARDEVIAAFTDLCERALTQIEAHEATIANLRAQLEEQGNFW
jgi:hypothetical protein